MAGRFQKEARGMAFYLAAVAFLVVVAAFVVPWLIQFERVDACVDRGGRYDYDARRCEFESGTR